MQMLFSYQRIVLHFNFMVFEPQAEKFPCMKYGNTVKVNKPFFFFSHKNRFCVRFGSVYEMSQPRVARTNFYSLVDFTITF